MSRLKKGKDLKRWSSNRPDSPPGKLRIIGGEFGGRQIETTGDPRTRPMKDNIREAMFNLVGGWIQGMAAIDLFAGSGAIGLEALSRGCSHGLFIERHFPTARLIERNIRSLRLEERSKVYTSDTFFWFRQFVASPENWPGEAWVVFCSPPYDFYLDRSDSLLEMLGQFISIAPRDSLIVVESDARFDRKHLPQSDLWRFREYSPAQIGIFRKSTAVEDSENLPA